MEVTPELFAAAERNRNPSLYDMTKRTEFYLPEQHLDDQCLLSEFACDLLDEKHLAELSDDIFVSLGCGQKYGSPDPFVWPLELGPCRLSIYPDQGNVSIEHGGLEITLPIATLGQLRCLVHSLDVPNSHPSTEAC